MSKVSLQWESADRTTISRERDKGAYRDESSAVTGHLIAIDRIEYTSRKRAAAWVFGRRRLRPDSIRSECA